MCRILIYKNDEECRKGCHPVMRRYTYKGKEREEHYFSVDEPGAWYWDDKWNCHVDGCDYPCASREEAIRKGADVLYMPEIHGSSEIEIIYQC